MFLILDTFTYLKDVFGSLVRLAPDALHIHLGIAIYVTVALVVRGPRAFVTAFWVVLAVAVMAEVFDLLYDLEVGRNLRWLDSLKDIVNAMVWPAAWMVFGRRIARRFRAGTAKRTGPDPVTEHGTGLEHAPAGSLSVGEPASWQNPPTIAPPIAPALGSDAPAARAGALQGIEGIAK